LEGRGKVSLDASRYMADVVVDKELMTVPELATLQHFYSIPWYIMVKFAMWDDLLKETAPDPSLVYPTAVWNYAQGMANATRGNYDKASQNLKVVRDAIKDTSISKMTVWEINSLVDVLKVAEQVLQGQIVLQQGHADIAVRFFEQAVKIEDGLNYNEPPDWFFSVRHHLGDALLKAGKFADAENVYRTDLKEWKNNGWALKGLHEAQLRQGKNAEAEETLAKFKEAWKYAEVELNSSVL
jgi:tetratricopeptide (TPR) repeat protein